MGHKLNSTMTDTTELATLPTPPVVLGTVDHMPDAEDLADFNRRDRSTGCNL
jgi:hypothetical protein